MIKLFFDHVFENYSLKKKNYDVILKALDLSFHSNFGKKVFFKIILCENLFFPKPSIHKWNESINLWNNGRTT